MDLPQDIFINVWRHFGLSQLGVGYREWYLYLVDRGLGYCLKFYNAQDSSPTILISLFSFVLPCLLLSFSLYPLMVYFIPGEYTLTVYLFYPNRYPPHWSFKYFQNVWIGSYSTSFKLLDNMGIISKGISWTFTLPHLQHNNLYSDDTQWMPTDIMKWHFSTKNGSF